MQLNSCNILCSIVRARQGLACGIPTISLSLKTFLGLGSLVNAFVLEREHMNAMGLECTLHCYRNHLAAVHTCTCMCSIHSCRFRGILDM